VVLVNAHNIDLYREFSMLTTSKGLLTAEISVNPTMSLKKIVTQLNCSALTSQSSTLTVDFQVFDLDL